MCNQQLEFEKKVINYNNNIVELLSKLIEPLLINFNIENFSYIKFVENKVIRISNNLSWNEYHIGNKLYDKDPYQDILLDMENNTSKFKFWNNNSKLVQNMMKHGFHNSMSIIKKYDNYTEIYNFGIKRDCSDPVDFYLNHIKYLERFIVYFKSKISDLLSTAEKEHYLIRTSKIITDNNQDFLKSESNNYKFLQMTNLDKLNIDKLHLSKREAECMYLLYYNNSIKSIAKKLSLSPRTVETYINQAKIKLGEVGNSKLTNYFYKNIINYYELTISS